jgi:hypothetical protein
VAIRTPAVGKTKLYGKLGVRGTAAFVMPEQNIMKLIISCTQEYLITLFIKCKYKKSLNICTSMKSHLSRELFSYANIRIVNSYNF